MAFEVTAAVFPDIILSSPRWMTHRCGRSCGGLIQDIAAASHMAHPYLVPSLELEGHCKTAELPAQNGMSSSISPAAPPPLDSAGRRSGAGARLKPEEPRSSSGKLWRLSELARESSNCNSPRKRCSTTSVV